MTILNLFRPKWKNSDWEVRLKAIPSISDPNILINLAKNDSNSDIRKKAIEKINNQEVLVSIAKNDKHHSVRLSAFEKITNEDVLSSIAINDDDANIRLYAVANITNQEVLTKIAKNDSNSDIRKVAIEKITNQEVLVSIAENDKHHSVRLSAFEKITNEDVLSSIAINDDDANIRLYAVANITNQEVLTKIAKNDSNSEVRKVAVEKITNQNILADIATNDDIEEVRNAAKTNTNLTDRELISAIDNNYKKRENRKILKIERGDSLYTYHDNILIVIVNIGNSNLDKELAKFYSGEFVRGINDLTNVDYEHYNKPNSHKASILIIHRANELKFDAYIIPEAQDFLGMFKVSIGYLVPAIPKQNPKVFLSSADTVKEFSNLFEVMKYSSKFEKDLNETSELYKSKKK